MILLEIIAIVFLGLTVPGYAQEIREWTSSSGSKITASLVQFENGQVTLRRENGKPIVVQLTQLSPEDQAFLAAHDSNQSADLTIVPALKGKKIGVILDASGSVAEWLPVVLKEVDVAFGDCPIVYIRNAKIAGDELSEINPIKSSEVVQERKDGTRSPYWFLWGDLPRKTPQKAVDSVIETFKTRKNQYLADRIGNQLLAAMSFLEKEDCDTIYVLSDFEDYVEEKDAASHGKLLARKKVKVYAQPVREKASFLDAFDTSIVQPTGGKLLPPVEKLAKQ